MLQLVRGKEDEGLADEAALRAGWARLFDNVARHRPDLVLDGALVEALGRKGLELVVGARRDADWGRCCWSAWVASGSRR